LISQTLRKWFFVLLVYFAMILGFWGTNWWSRADALESEAFSYKTALIAQRLTEAVRFLNYQVQGVASLVRNCNKPEACSKAIEAEKNRIRETTFGQARNLRIVVLNSDGKELLSDGAMSANKSTLASSPCFVELMKLKDASLLRSLSSPYTLPDNAKLRACVFHPVLDVTNQVSSVVIAEFSLEDLRNQVFPYRLDTGVADQSKAVGVYGWRHQKLVAYVRSDNLERKDPLEPVVLDASLEQIAEVLADRSEFGSDVVLSANGDAHREAIQASTALKLYVHYRENVPSPNHFDPLWWIGLGLIVIGFLRDIGKPFLTGALKKI